MTQPVSTPNIFDFAPKELSQDAFLCWLISWAKDEYNTELATIGRSFVASLYSHSTGNKVGASDITQVTSIKKQHYHTDVYFEATVKGKPAIFVIEDKVNAAIGKDQLQNYQKAVMGKSRTEKHDYVFIFYKTGYVYDEEHKKVREAGYKLVDSKWMHSFLHENESDHPIYLDYKAYLNSSFVIPFSNIESFMGTPSDLSGFDKDYVQYEFMKRFVASLQAIDKSTKEFKIGTSFGRPYTQFWFHDYAVAEGETEGLFYRIDRRKNPKTKKNDPYLRLNQYRWVKGDREKIKAKKERLCRLRELFQESAAESHVTLQFARLSDKGDNESEVGILFFDHDTNTPESVLNQMPKIHRTFMEKLKQDRQYVFA